MQDDISQEIWDCKRQNQFDKNPNTISVIPGSMSGTSDRLKIVRALLGFGTQQEMADWLGIEFNRWNNMERGSPLSHEVAVMLCQKIPGMTLDWLHFGKADGMPLELARRIGEAPGEAGGPSKVTTAPRRA